LDSDSIGQLILLGFLLLFSAFFSASETALISLSKIRLRHMVEEKLKGAELINTLLQTPDKLLGTILVGNNIVNIGASALATALAISFFGNNGVVIATAAMTVLVLIFGEITPKALAAENSEKISRKVSKPISFIVILLKPIVSVFIAISNVLIRLLGGKKREKRPFVTGEELKTIVRVGHKEGVFKVEEKQMIYNVLEFGDLHVRDVMLPRTDVVAISYPTTYDELLAFLKHEHYSRIPVYDNSLDNILGILNVKDLIHYDKGTADFDIRHFLREPFYIYEYIKIPALFKQMKKSKSEIAIVVDEYGGTSGLVTLEDLIVEIVGNIDEYDEAEKAVEFIRDREYLVEGSTKIEEVNEMLGISIESEEFDSIGGFVFGEFGYFPKVGETIVYNAITLKVEDIIRNRITKVRIFI
jgi:putative hemolysin